MSKLTLILLLGATIANATLINEEVSRVIDLKAHLVKISTTVTLKNDGASSVSSFEYSVEPSHAKQLAYISVSQGGEGGESVNFKLTQKDVAKKLFSVTLPKKLDAKSSVKFVVEEVFAGALSPFPKEISQSQSQLIIYRGNHFYYSPYQTVSQSTTVELPSNTIESYSKFGNPSKEDSVIKYEDSTEFENVPANSQNAMKIHYENNSPFLTISKLTRVVEVSHWGNIAVEENVDIRHTGSKLKGSFSRYDYQRQPNSGASSVKSFKTILPASAADVYYRDEIGNISTSNLYEKDDSVDFEIRPRFPLFGGWKTHYYFGYNLPSYNYLYSRGDLNAIKIRFVDHVMDEQMVEDFTLKVILPEGSKNIKVHLPYEAKREKDELHLTYLDTVGRPVIIFTKQNLVEQHIEDFTLTYTFNRLLLLQEPLLIVGAFFLLFFTVIIIVRLDFSIAHDKMSEARMRVQGVIEKVQSEQAKRDGCYKAYESAVTKFKATKDHSAFSQSRRSIEKDHKEATNSINQLLSKLREDAAEAAERVAGLNTLDSNIKEKISQTIQLAEKLVQKKMTRDQYLEHDGKCQKAIEDMKQKICDVTDAL
uniref:Dolichyl-diphosphooligosaccharide--protein glycosyltransferase subunit 1 n=1 Tax=Phallusia mammillata TaxID=59560 RepID=A0A6F9DRV5_9ASCI|nr:dolichyl-diphosphooligosaccharide--protein glycosyltransferase subunit 1-like [Phallusia mammillata]